MAISALSLSFLANSYAQDAPPQMPPRIMGTIESFDGQTLKLKTTEREDAAITIGPKTQIIENRPGKMSDVQSGRFIGTTAVEEKDGKLHAREVHVFAEELRGAGEGHYPMGPPNTTMTNGNVATMTNGNVQQASGGASGMTMRVTYKGGESEVLVPPSTPVTVMEVRDQSMLKPGKKVTVFAQKDPSGVLSAGAVIIGPMGPPGK